MRSTTQMHHRVRCDTCLGPDDRPLALTPEGIDVAGRAATSAARAHLGDHPGHMVSMTYVAEVAFWADGGDR